MKIIQATIAALLLAATSVARAEEEPPPTKLYDDYLSHTEGSERARALLEDMANRCEYSEMSRTGPLPWQVAQCERSVRRAVALGASVVPDALRKLNEDPLGFGARIRTYDLLARVGDLRTLESLVAALPKLERSDPVGERELVVSTLARISYAKVGETAPFSDRDPDPAALTSGWRRWLSEHRG